MKKICGSNQSGRSMIEMLGVLAIIGVLSVGGISGYSKAMAKYKTNKTLDQLSLLITNIRTLYANQVSYDGLDNAAAVDFELVSQDMIKTTGTGQGAKQSLVNPYGGSVTLGTSTDKMEFTIAYENVDRQACITLITSDWGGSASSGLVSIAVGTTTYSWANNTLPVSLSNASTACADDSSNTITWTSR